MASVSPASEVFGDFFALERDPRTSGWYSTGTLCVPVVLLIYLTVTNVMPAVMQKRKQRLPISSAVLFFNGFQCAAHAIVGGLLLIRYLQTGRSLVCEASTFSEDEHSRSILNLMWLYLGLKMLSMLDSLILMSSLKEKRITNANLLNGFLSVVNAWAFLRYGADTHGVAGVVVGCTVDVITYSYFLCSLLGPKVMGVLRPQRINVTRLQLLGTSISMGHYFIAIIGECGYPTTLALLGFSHSGLRFLRLFDFYTEKYILNGSRLGLDWSIIAGLLENCCFAQGNPNQYTEEDEDQDTTCSTSGFRSGFSGPIKPKRG